MVPISSPPPQRPATSRFRPRPCTRPDLHGPPCRRPTSPQRILLPIRSDMAGSAGCRAPVRDRPRRSPGSKVWPRGARPKNPAWPSLGCETRGRRRPRNRHRTRGPTGHRRRRGGTGPHGGCAAPAHRTPEPRHRWYLDEAARVELRDEQPGAGVCWTRRPTSGGARRSDETTA